MPCGSVAGDLPAMAWDLEVRFLDSERWFCRSARDTVYDYSGILTLPFGVFPFIKPYFRLADRVP